MIGKLELLDSGCALEPPETSHKQGPMPDHPRQDLGALQETPRLGITAAGGWESSKGSGSRGIERCRGMWGSVTGRRGGATANPREGDGACSRDGC